MLIYLISGIALLLGGYLGHKSSFHFDRLNASRLLNGSLSVLSFFTCLMIAWYIGLFPQSVAAPFMTFIYSLVAGFFNGYAFRLLQLRREMGDVLYMHRSFWIDHAPNLAAILLIVYGLFRTSLFLEQPVTGIRLSSGLSLMSIGFFGWTLRIVPEFRSTGILFLDRIIEWRQVMSWDWYSEDIIRIEYLHEPESTDEEIRELQTAIPPEEKLHIEAILKSKMESSHTEREKLLLRKNDEDS